MIYVFLPAYNEEIALRPLVHKIHETLIKLMPYHILILNDGSNDQTETVVLELKRDYPITVLSHNINQGLGQTMIDGLNYLAKIATEEDLIVTLDSDNTHEPNYISIAIQKIRDGYDLVIMSRFQKGGKEIGLSFGRKIMSRGACLFLKIFFPIKGIRDYSCGFRVFQASAIRRAIQTFDKEFIRLPHLGFVVMCEILIKLRLLGCRITEIPFILRYDQKPGRSKNNIFRTILGYFLLVSLYWGKSLKYTAPLRMNRSDIS